MKETRLNSPWGAVTVRPETDHLIAVQGETDCAVFFGQGYADAQLRLWQLDLARRVAAGELSEIMGRTTLRTDQFQRRLGLRVLAERAAALDAAAPAGSPQAEQYQHIQAYTAGLNQGIRAMKIRPAECLLLRYKPAPFCETDCYLTAQLKYFINSAWQYELFHTRLAGKLTPEQHRRLFTTVSEEGNTITPPFYTENGDYAPAVIAALQDGLRALELLGLDSPDTGSNVIAVSGHHTASGKPLVAADPHMGQVSPGFNVLYKLESDEGLAVTGSHFPGTPGIIVGRNRHAAWGMVGIMADNQDLFAGEIDTVNMTVATADGPQPLTRREHRIRIRRGADDTLITYDFAQGQLLYEKDGHGLFLRWPALDFPGGDITFYQLAKCTDKTTFRAALAPVRNAPMMVGYADIHGDTALQAMGYIPRRTQETGSLVLSLTNPAHRWHGYVPYADLPCEYNPPDGYAYYANQYSERLFRGKVSLSDRWHPPGRALRIRELLMQRDDHDIASLQALQDDKTDLFVRRALPVLLPLLNGPCRLSDWDGDTRDVQAAMLFDRWFHHLTVMLLSGVTDSTSQARYCDFWPGCRWALLSLLQSQLSRSQLLQSPLCTPGRTSARTPDSAPDFSPGFSPEGIRRQVQAAYDRAEAAQQNAVLPVAEFRHTIKSPAWLHRLLSGRYPYQGGGRETIHATRQTADFLTQSQSGSSSSRPVSAPYTFGPGFKLICPLDDSGDMYYLINTPADGRPLTGRLNRTLRRWQAGERERTSLRRQD